MPSKPIRILIALLSLAALTRSGTYRWCRYLAQHGVSAFTIRYQLASEKLGIKPDRCVRDAKTAIRWVRANAKKFGINPEQSAAAGNSAGGHLSAALATIDGFKSSHFEGGVRVPMIFWAKALAGSPITRPHRAPAS